MFVGPQVGVASGGFQALLVPHRPLGDRARTVAAPMVECSQVLQARVRVVLLV